MRGTRALIGTHGLSQTRNLMQLWKLRAEIKVQTDLVALQLSFATSSLVHL
jgi:hypothetical protein